MADTYDVTGQQRFTDFSGGGLGAPAVKISYKTKAHGVEGSVSVDEADYNLDNVRAKLEAAAATDEAIASH